jgi:hypothetical protein
METSTPIHYRLEKVLKEELKGRVAALPWLMSQDRPEAEPPYAILQCDEAAETTPESGVFYVKTALLVTHPLDEGSGKEHAQRVQEVQMALNAIPRPGWDEENGLRLFGFVVMRTSSSNMEQEQGTLFELNVGCGRAETPLEEPSQTPDVEL